jgi:hypothetical protein
MLRAFHDVPTRLVPIAYRCRVNTLTVFIVALGTALATGLGVFPVLAVRGKERLSIAVSSALAAGCMLGASVGLFYEGILRNWSGTVVGAVIGAAFILLATRWLARFPDAHVGTLKGARPCTRSPRASRSVSRSQGSDL